MATRPGNFVLRTDTSGRQFYVNESTGEVLQHLPGTSPSGPLASINPQLLATASEDLPDGWEKAMDLTGRVYYIDHIGKKTSWTVPTRPQVEPVHKATF
jgi:hypothetical protein